MNMFNCFNGTRFVRFQHAALFAGSLLLLGATFSAHADEIQDANKLFKQHQYGTALNKVNAFLSSKPKDAQARFLKGLILTEQGKTNDAVKVFSDLTEDYPELPEPYNNLAVLYAGQGQYDKAKTALEMAIRTHPSYATAHENLGDIYAKMASQAYDRALQLDRSNTSTQTKLAMIQELFADTPQSKANSTPPPPAVALNKKIEPVKIPAPSTVADFVAPPANKNPPSALVTTPTASVATEKPTTVTSSTKNSSKDVLKTVNAWAAAWAAQNVKKYLSFYAEDFKTSDGESRADWEATRHDRLSKPKYIRVKITSPSVDFTDSNHATVKFHQSYRASHFKASGTKTMRLVKSGDKWLIQEELAQ